MAIKQDIMVMRKEIDKSREYYFEKIVNVILTNVKNYNSDSWDKSLNKIIDLFYDSLTETYSITIKNLKKCYKKLPDFSIDNIFDLTYSKDGKTIEERLTGYWVEGKKRLNQNHFNAKDEELGHVDSIDEVAEYLIDKYDRISITETRIIEAKLKEKKKPLNAEMLIIESGCDICQGGEYAADENVDLPPYHPNCQCTYYWVVTDDEDDIHDLDLEVDDLA